MARHLLDQGKRIRVTDIREPAWLGDYEKHRNEAQLSYIPGNLTDKDSLRYSVHGVKKAFHFGGLFNHAASYDALMKVNADGTENFFGAAKDAGIERIVHIGSLTAYGVHHRPENGEKYAVNETKETRPADPYGKSKQASREIAASYNGDLEVLIVDPAGVWGPHSVYGNVDLIKMLISGAMLMPDGGHHKSSHVHSHDVIRLCDHLMDSEITHEGTEPGPLSYLATDTTPATGEYLMELIWDKIPPPGRNYMIKDITKAISPLIVKKELIIPVAHVVNYLARAFNATIGSLCNWKVQPSLNPYTARYGFSELSCDPTKMLSTGFELKYPETWQTIGDVLEWHCRDGLLKKMCKRYQGIKR